MLKGDVHPWFENSIIYNSEGTDLPKSDKRRRERIGESTVEEPLQLSGDYVKDTNISWGVDGLAQGS